MRPRRLWGAAPGLALAAGLLSGCLGAPGGNDPSGSGGLSSAPSGSSASSTSATVSGVGPAEMPGYRLVFTDDFGRDSLGPDWGTYSGRPGGDQYTIWSPTHVQVQDGQLLLQGYRDNGAWTTGGVSNWPVTQTYGRWEVRFRAPASDEITYHFLLWPKSDHWPPEIDFAEDFGGARQGISAFLHENVGGRDRQTQRQLTGVDFTDWQTVGVQWSPGLVQFFVNGREWDRISGSGVPDEPMWLGLQAQAGGCERKASYGFPDCPIVGAPDSTTIAIDWVAVYAPSA